VGVRIRAVKAVMRSGVVQHASPVVRDWLFAILVRGEKAGRRTEVHERKELPVQERNADR
jgi:hypothetical protein